MRPPSLLTAEFQVEIFGSYAWGSMILETPLLSAFQPAAACLGCGEVTLRFVFQKKVDKLHESMRKRHMIPPILIGGFGGLITIAGVMVLLDDLHAAGEWIPPIVIGFLLMFWGFRIVKWYRGAKPPPGGIFGTLKTRVTIGAILYLAGAFGMIGGFIILLVEGWKTGLLALGVSCIPLVLGEYLARTAENKAQELSADLDSTVSLKIPLILIVLGGMLTVGSAEPIAAGNYSAAFTMVSVGVGLLFKGISDYRHDEVAP